MPSFLVEFNSKQTLKFYIKIASMSLTLLVLISDEEKKIMLNFYFNTTFRNARDVKF